MQTVFFLLSFLFLFHPFIPAETALAQQVIAPRNAYTDIIVINREPAHLTVYTNMPNAGWRLYRYSDLIYSGVGGMTNFQLVEGNNYRIIPQEIEGYYVRVYPPDTFRVLSGEYFSIQIVYERQYGYINVKGELPEGEAVEALIVPMDRAVHPFTVKMKSSQGKINWQSAPIPTGYYQIVYKLPFKHQQIPPEKVLILDGETVYLRPRFFTPGKLHVTANIPQAVYDLRTVNNTRSWQGEGQDYTFTGLPAGSYTLNFGVKGVEYYIPPKEMRISVNDYENKDIKVSYQAAGKLMLNTNVERTEISIDDLSVYHKNFKEEIVGGSKMVTLPVGKYRITFADQDKLAAPAPIEFEMLPFRSERLNGTYHRQMPSPDEKMGKLTITLNIRDAGYEVKKVSGGSPEILGHYNGKSNTVSLQPFESYEISFEDVPNYKTPEKISISLAVSEQKTINVDYTTARETALVSAGRAIIGEQSGNQENVLPSKIVNISAFEIGLYEITNKEFADWLNKALKQKTVVYVSEADQRGQILDMSNNLLFKTFETDAYSQISAQQTTGGTITFAPIAGKELYPVINVSWYGAVAYCKDNHCRLPTEAEWEKAGGMQPEKAGEPLKKFKFGFSRDEIDRTWANFKESDSEIQRFQVLTTPIGFYNGVNLLPLTLKTTQQQKTHLAQSPYGAFDISGNVWEWVSDWYDDGYVKNMSDTDPKGPQNGTKKVVKGGCYDSLADGVRVAERLGLAPSHTDAYTGFRIARDVGSEAGKK